MAKVKDYYCYVCEKKLDYKPTRMVRQEYGISSYKQYYQVEHFDLCERCFKIIRKAVRKMKKEKLYEKVK